MNNYPDQIKEIAEIIHSGMQQKQNYILVGENSSGKSDILKTVLNKKIGSNIYFIDSVNRTYDYEKVAFEREEKARLDFECVINERVKPGNFNLQDTFRAMSCIEASYCQYERKLYEMCKAFLKVDMQITREQMGAGLVENKVLIHGKKMQLSNGYQAVLRIFSELLYFCDVLDMQHVDQGFVVIDELDEYLSPQYGSKILGFLQKYFSNLCFLVTTHSIDVVKYSEKTELIVLNDNSYDLYSALQLQDENFVEDIFSCIFFKDRSIHQSNNDELDERLRRLFNMKIAERWNEYAEKEFQAIKQKELLPHQQLIVRQIEEW